MLQTFRQKTHTQVKLKLSSLGASPRMLFVSVVLVRKIVNDLPFSMTASLKDIQSSVLG